MELRVLILLFYISCLYIVNCDLVKPDSSRDGFISKCLGKRSVGDGNCEDLRYPILDSFYTCEVVGSFDYAPKRISTKNDSFFVALNRKTFSITKPGESPVEVNTVIPPTREVIDKSNNRFYNDYGTTYMIGKNDGKAVEIVTSENDCLNELAMDYENNILFILSLSVERNKKRSGSLYILKTDQIVVENTGKVKATKIDDFGKRFSAMTIPKNSNFILLGVTGENKGGKLIKLIRNKNDPCPAQMDKRVDFQKTLREATQRLTKIFNDAMSQNRKTGSVARVSAIDDIKSKNDQTEIRMLRMENQRLERQLNITTMKFETYSGRISSFSSSLKKVQAQPDLTKVSVLVNENGNDLICLRTREIEELRQDNLNFRNRVDLLENMLSGTIRVLEALGESPESVKIPVSVEVSSFSTEPPETDSKEEATAGTDDDAAETDEEYRARLNKYFMLSKILGDKTQLVK